MDTCGCDDLEVDPSGILMYVHCRRCVAEIPRGVSPRDFASNEIGVGVDGSLIVWCKRHDLQVGKFPPSEMSRRLVGIEGN